MSNLSLPLSATNRSTSEEIALAGLYRLATATRTLVNPELNKNNSKGDAKQNDTIKKRNDNTEGKRKVMSTVLYSNNDPATKRSKISHFQNVTNNIGSNIPDLTACLNQEGYQTLPPPQSQQQNSMNAFHNMAATPPAAAP